jgi:N-methylhydantoinase A
MRYGEQVFEIPVGLDGADLSDSAAIAERFHAAHESLYTYALRDQEAVLVNARLSVIGRLPPVIQGQTADRPEAPAKAMRRVWLGGWTEIPVYDFLALGIGQTIAGPALVESDTTTVLLRAGDRARFDRGGWLDVAVDVGGGAS